MIILNLITYINRNYIISEHLHPTDMLGYMDSVIDDINDDLVMSISGISFCPNDAHPIILQRADYIVPFPGGRGAVRYVCDLLLEAQNHPLSLDDHW